MSEAPERIWLLWKDPAVAQRYAASAMNHDEEGYKAYIRVDLAQPAPELLAALADIALVAKNGTGHNLAPVVRLAQRIEAMALSAIAKAEGR